MLEEPPFETGQPVRIAMRHFSSAEENKAVVERIVEQVINQKKLAMVDELFSEKYHPHPSRHERPIGPEYAKRNFSRMHKAFPDLRAVIERMVAEGDMVAVQVTLSGTHLPTGQRTTWSAMVFARFADGKVTEDWLLVDSRQIETRLG
jgi:predicted SnoaL-like aldol condensation-catalyzing enzyme